MNRLHLMSTRGAAIAVLLGAGTLSAQRTADRGAFLMRLGVDTIAIERFERTGDTIQGTISVTGQPRLVYVAVLGPAFSVGSLSLNVFREMAADSAPLQRIGIAMRDDSVFADINGMPRRFATRPGAAPLLNNSFALAEVLTRHARAVGDSADL
ncbi:MAG: hypothetical protein ACRELE_07125, partial [Gemmatimonadales bacterium]